MDHPDHYDLALLITDRDMKYRGNRATLGMAQMGGMCTGSEDGNSCAMVEDDGLITGITIAHEVRKTEQKKDFYF